MTNRPNDHLEPAFGYPLTTRYRLNREQLAAVLDLAGIIPSGRLLSPVPAVADPRSVLDSTDLISGDSEVAPVLREAISILARPVRVFHVIATVPGADEWADLYLAAPETAGPYVHGRQTEDGLDLTILATDLEAVTVIDRLLRLTGFASQAFEPDIALSLEGWVGLLAAVDVERQRNLQAQLARQTFPSSVTFSSDDLETQLTTGLDTTDTRWAVTTAIPVAPVRLADCNLGGETLLGHLESLQLVVPADGTYRLSDLGRHLAELISQTVVVGSLTLTLDHSGRLTRAGEVLVYRTPTRLAVGLWTGTVDDPVLTIVEPTGDFAVGMIKKILESSVSLPRLLEPTDTPLCPKCGAEAIPEGRFCTRCGTAIKPDDST